MRKVAEKHRNWLLGELPLLQQEGVLAPETADAVRAYYAQNTRSGLHWALVICAVLGALLIGSGIILLFAHNWEALSRPARAALAVCPILLGSGLGLAALWRGGGTAWREAAGLFHALAVGASIALIGQTYHLPGDTPAFLLTWALLVLPLSLLLRASAASLVYLALVCGWCAAAQSAYGQAAAFWPLLLPSLVHVARLLRDDRHAPGTAVSLAGLLLALCVGTGLALERTVPGLWIVAYAALLSAAALLGLQLFPGRDGWGNLPKAFGLLGTVILAYIFTWPELWREIGWTHLRHDWAFRAWGVWFDAGVTVALLAAWAFAAVTAFRRDSVETLTLAALPVVASLGFVTSTLCRGAATLNALVFNGYMLLLGVMHIVLGCRASRLRQLNFGMATVALLLVTRFFDTDFPYWLRGIVFIALGSLFLTVNLLMARHKKQKGLPA